MRHLNPMGSDAGEQGEHPKTQFVLNPSNSSSFLSRGFRAAQNGDAEKDGVPVKHQRSSACKADTARNCFVD